MRIRMADDGFVTKIIEVARIENDKKYIYVYEDVYGIHGIATLHTHADTETLVCQLLKNGYADLSKYNYVTGVEKYASKS